MITCPFCGKPVFRANDERDTNSMLENNSTDNFYCPTYVDMTVGIRWCHYQRTSNANAHYSAVMPPFLIIWQLDGQLSVDQILHYTSEYITDSKRVYEAKTDDFNEFVRICNRFKKLVIFS